jgi:hypothetical protein
MTHQTPAELAGAAAEAIRQLNHRTLNGGDGWTYPGDAYTVLGALDSAAGGLPQVLGQVRAFLNRLDALGHLRSDHGPVDHDLNAALFALRDAAQHAAGLREALGRAHSATGHLGWLDA